MINDKFRLLRKNERNCDNLVARKTSNFWTKVEKDKQKFGRFVTFFAISKSMPVLSRADFDADWFVCAPASKPYVYHWPFIIVESVICNTEHIIEFNDRDTHSCWIHVQQTHQPILSECNSKNIPAINFTKPLLWR